MKRNKPVTVALLIATLAAIGLLMGYQMGKKSVGSQAEVEVNASAGIVLLYIAYQLHEDKPEKALEQANLFLSEIHRFFGQHQSHARSSEPGASDRVTLRIEEYFQKYYAGDIEGHSFQTQMDKAFEDFEAKTKEHLKP